MPRLPLKILGALAVLAGLWLVLPAQLGGTTSYLITSGTSMQPAFHAGTLVAARPAALYEVGDVVAYRAPHTGQIVLHRIVNRDGDAFVLQGDNNTWLDSARPHADEIVGGVSWQAPHAGKALAVLRRPPVLAALTALIAAFAFRRRSTTRTASSRSHTMPNSLRFPRSRPTPAAHPARRTPASEQLTPRRVRAGLLFAAAVVLAVAGLAWPSPGAGGGASAEVHRTSFDYATEGLDAQVYQDGRLPNGGPVFTQVVDRLAVRVDYERAVVAASTDGAVPTSDAGAVALPDDGRGTFLIEAELRDPAGWTRVWTLATGTFEGAGFTEHVLLDLPAFERAAAAVAERTGTSSPTRALVLSSTVEADGHEHVAATEFRLDGAVLRPASADTADPASGLTVLERLEPAEAPAAPTLPFGASPPQAALLVLAVLAVAGGAALRRPRSGSLPPDVELRHRLKALPVSTWRNLTDGPVADLADPKALAALASMHGARILEVGDPRPAFLLHAGGVTYRYLPPSFPVAVSQRRAA